MRSDPNSKSESNSNSKIVKPSRRKLVPLSRLKNAEWNPPNRISGRVLRDLEDSIDRIGLLHPITIDKEYNIVDGHRRVACARNLGWNDIECNIVEDLDSAEVYASVNVSSKRMTGKDALSVWYINRYAVTDRQRKKFDEAEAAIGRDMIKKIIDIGGSILIYDLAKKVCCYCGDEKKATFKLVMKWLCEVSLIGPVREALKAGQPGDIIMNAVKEMKPLTFTLTHHHNNNNDGGSDERKVNEL